MLQKSKELRKVTTCSDIALEAEELFAWIMNFINCIAILLVVTYTSAKPTATLDELVNDIVDDVMDHIRTEKQDISSINPQPDCKKKCAKSIDYVCANNGRVYPSICAMKQSSCFSKKPLTAVFNIYDVCKENSNKKGPVCGSNYETYSDRCQMERTNCENKNKNENKRITVLHEGKCKEKCETDARICRNSLKSPVCGSDGKTHESGCIKTFNCEQDEKVAEVSTGKCKKECISRDIGRYFINKVCGSDGITYDNKFLMEQSSCNSKQTITISNKGGCTKECPPDCPNDKSAPICGSDGRTYSSKCQLMLRNCKSTEKVTIAFEEKCKVKETD